MHVCMCQTFVFVYVLLLCFVSSDYFKSKSPRLERSWVGYGRDYVRITWFSRVLWRLWFVMWINKSRNPHSWRRWRQWWRVEGKEACYIMDYEKRQFMFRFGANINKAHDFIFEKTQPSGVFHTTEPTLRTHHGWNTVDSFLAQKPARDRFKETTDMRRC